MTLSVSHTRGFFFHHRTEHSSFIAQKVCTSRDITTTAAGFGTAKKETHCICTLLKFGMNSEYGCERTCYMMRTVLKLFRDQVYT